MNSRNGQPLPKQAILMAAQQLYSGLSAIHNLGVIFRDLKLKNILISEFGNLNISDFGLAKWLNRHQRTYTICGTLSFMAPEVALSQPYHHRYVLEICLKNIAAVHSLNTGSNITPIYYHYF